MQESNCRDFRLQCTGCPREDQSRDMGFRRTNPTGKDWEQTKLICDLPPEAVPAYWEGGVTDA